MMPVTSAPIASVSTPIGSRISIRDWDRWREVATNHGPHGDRNHRFTVDQHALADLEAKPFQPAQSLALAGTFGIAQHRHDVEHDRHLPPALAQEPLLEIGRASCR